MIKSEEYALQLSTQLRKGFLAFCVLKVCAKTPQYTTEIIDRLHRADLVVVEGTLYPLLSRLQKDGLLTHEWRESEQGPPRKYYVITNFGEEVMTMTGKQINTLKKAVSKL